MANEIKGSPFLNSERTHTYCTHTHTCAEEGTEAALLTCIVLPRKCPSPAVPRTEL